jgi:hypothetical protein
VFVSSAVMALQFEEIAAERSTEPKGAAVEKD